MKPSFAFAFPGNVHVGTAGGPGPGANTIVLDSTKAVIGDGLEDYYREMRITITSGAGAGQSRNIVSYNTATKTANVDTNWTAAPDLASQYYIDIPIPAQPSPSTRYSTHITASPYLYNMACITADELLSVSTTSTKIYDSVTGPATMTFVISTGLTVDTGRWVRIVYDSQNYIIGTVNSYTSGSGSLVVNVKKAVRSSQVARNVWTVYYICGSGMEIDGYKAAGLRSFVSAQFTQFNSGGDGVVMRNMGYAQLVSIYAICCEDAFLAESGGTASMGNCNVNFGTFGLVAQDVGPLLMSGRAGFIYDKARCSRDTRLIVEGLTQDLLNEGVNQSVFSGIQYWNQDSVVANSTSTVSITTGNKTFIIETNLTTDKFAVNDYVRVIYDELNYMYGQVVSYNPGTGSTVIQISRAVSDPPSPTQSFSSWKILGPGTNRVPDSQKAATVAAIKFAGANAALKVATTAEKNFVTDAFDKIADIVAYGTSDLTNQIIRNSVTISTTPAVVAANTAIQSGKGDAVTAGSIIKATIDKINQDFPSLSYSATKCARDLSYIIDCVCFDLMYNIDGTYAQPSNRQAIQAGVYYYGYTTKSALDSEIPQTIDAFTQLKTEISALLPGGTYASIRPLVNTKIDVINDLIRFGPTGATTFTGTISGTTLTVTSVSANTIRVGMEITQNAVGSILTQLTGTNGGAGTYQLSRSQTVATPKVFFADYTTPITFERNTDATLLAAANILETNRTALGTTITNYVDSVTGNGYDNQTGYFINVSNIIACTDPRFAITEDTKPYLGLVMHIDGEKTIDIQPGPGYDPGEVIKIYARDSVTNYMIGTVVSHDLVTSTTVVNISSSNGSGTFQYWETDLNPTPAKKGRFTQELTIAGSGTITITSIDTSREINKYRTIVYANTVGDITFLELDERITSTLTLNGTPYPNGIPKNTKLYFYQKSALSASGQTFEFVGSGTSTAVALPRNGGDIVQTNEIVSSNGGIVYFTSTDQFGNFRIGEDLTINFNTGTLSGRTFTRSLFAQITPFVLALDS
jgi:hypothetical protein